MSNSTRKNGEGLNIKPLIDFEQRVANLCLYNPVLAIGSGSAAKVLITTGATGIYTIEGVIYTSPASQEVEFTATTDDIIADATTVQEKTYLVCLDSAGTGSIVGGEQADTGESLAPDVDDDLCVIGKVVLKVAAGTTNFDASTDLLSASHITDTYTNLSMLVY
jgi:hypothetical protein